MTKSSTAPIEHGKDGAVAPVGWGSRRRRRTLGLCAHCQEPVEVDGEHVRLYRLAWHLECALAAGSGPAADFPPPPD